MAGSAAQQWEDERLEPRDPVFHRTRAVEGDGTAHPMVVVNLSPGGLMARCEAPLAPGAQLRVALPLLGPVEAEVRWVLAGRIGCRLAAAVPPATYHQLLAAVGRD